MSEPKLSIVPFGKYKGQPLEVMAQDQEYCEWLAAQDWVRMRYANIHTLIVNNFAEPHETPEHNALQALFIDVEWVKGFVWVYLGRDWEELISTELAETRAEQKEHLAILDQVVAKAESDLVKSQCKSTEDFSFKKRVQRDLILDGLEFLADALEHSELTNENGTVCLFAAREFHLALKSTALKEAVERIAGRQVDLYVMSPFHFIPDANEGHLANSISEREDFRAKYERRIKWLSGKVRPSLTIRDLTFENHGVDVMFRYHVSVCEDDLSNEALFKGRRVEGYKKEFLSPILYETTLRAECKPSVGDDYPAILRQMLAHHSNVLLIGRGGYRGVGVTFEQMVKIFAASGIKVMRLSEIG